MRGSWASEESWYDPACSSQRVTTRYVTRPAPPQQTRSLDIHLNRHQPTYPFFPVYSNQDYISLVCAQRLHWGYMDRAHGESVLDYA